MSIDLSGKWFTLISGVLNSKESACDEGDLGLIPGSGRSLGGGHGNPLQYSCLLNLHGQKSLADYSPWGHKELDRTERLSLTHSFTHSLVCSLCFWNSLQTAMYLCIRNKWIGINVLRTQSLELLGLDLKSHRGHLL